MAREAGMEVERYDALDSSSEDGSSLDEPSWISWFCLLRHHELFCEVDPAYIQDRFNLNGLKEEIGPLYGEAMAMILGTAPTERQLADPSQRIHKVLNTARVLYGLIHARYILTAQGLQDMKAKYHAREFGQCPRTFCHKHPLLPVGLGDQYSPVSDNPVQRFCQLCEEVYEAETGNTYIDGAFFGTTFPHLFTQSFPDTAPAKNSFKYVPRLFGFKLHASASARAPSPVEWPKRQKNDPDSEFDSPG
ncbi:hypothetical protein KFE25_012640 [Diacronema lutheri]|uniref:Casein kinase II subunit beta n=2 Tax=Diacronema lutheri TaxID=2081491 RepID=A0A8J5X9X3_DIALT|nr:hypothetical protein KFE25_012640 [Diacronema lutheri]